MKLHKLPLIAAATLATASLANAALTDTVVLRMGEAGTNTGDGLKPLNTVTGTTPFGGGNWTSISGTGIGAAGSTEYALFSGTSSSLWQGSLNGLANDNFGVEFWFRQDSASVGQTEYMFVSSSTGNGSLKIGISTAGLLDVSYHNVAGFGSGAAITLGEWYHIAVIRDAGISTLYLNGAASGPTTNQAAANGGTNFRLAETPGNSGLSFVGAIDEFRAFNFATGDGAIAVASLHTTAVPEPSTYGLMGAGALAAAAFVRRRRKSCR